MFNIISCWSSQTREPYPGLVLSKHASALAGNLTFNCQVTRVLSGKSHGFCTLQSHSHLTYVIWGRQLGQVREGCYSFSEREKLKLSSIASSHSDTPVPEQNTLPFTLWFVLRVNLNFCLWILRVWIQPHIAPPFLVIVFALPRLQSPASKEASPSPSLNSYTIYFTVISITN